MSELPEVIVRYLDAHRARDTATALTAFSDAAVVVDERQTYNGKAAVEGWLENAGAPYTFTIELGAVDRIDDSHYIVTNHLEGNFPGGQVDLRYQFTLEGDLIESLTIEP